MTNKLWLFVLLLVSPPGLAHDVPGVPAPSTESELLAAFGWDFDSAEVTTEKVTQNLHVLFGLGGNIAVSTGESGVLIVDDQFPQMISRVQTAIGKLGGREVDFAINTHWHFDHAAGNQVLGPKGTWLVSQANSRRMMQQDHVINLVGIAYEQEAYPTEAQPVITFENTMQFHFNGEQVDLYHFGPAHTTGDTAVVFRTSNAVHLRDVYNNSGYPFIDAGNGGTLSGVIRFCAETLKVIDKETVVIPGHGPIADYQALAAYVEMLKTVRARMLVLINQGASLSDIYAAKPTAEWDEKNGDNTGFINRSYLSLTHRVVDR